MSQPTVPIFISWSGKPARTVAVALGTFINDCIQAAQPWTSEEIPKGAAWSEAIIAQLKSSAVGIVCVTRANQDARWLAFEGGALAMNGALHVFLIDAKPTEIEPPLALYQTTGPTKDELLKMLSTIDAKLPEGSRRGRERLRRACDTHWPELETAIAKAQELSKEAAPPPVRTDRELLEEILTGVRALSSSTRDQVHPGSGKGYAAARRPGEWSQEGLLGALLAKVHDRPQAEHERGINALVDLGLLPRENAAHALSAFRRSKYQAERYNKTGQWPTEDEGES